MSRKPLPKPTLTPLPHDWRERVPTWRIIAMLAQVPQSEYLDEVRRFEADMLAEVRLSDNWGQEWKAFCWRRFKRPEMRCAFCDKPDAQRPIMCNPEDESSQKFRWFCNSWCQARFETNQPRPVEEPETLGWF